MTLPPEPEVPDQLLYTRKVSFFSTYGEFRSMIHSCADTSNLGPSERFKIGSNDNAESLG